MRRVLRVVIVLLAGFALGYTVSAYRGEPETSAVQFRLERAVPPEIERLARRTPCVVATEEERAAFEAAVQVLRHPSSQTGFLSTGAHRFLSGSMYRGDIGVSATVCDPPDIYATAGDLINDSDHLRRGRITEYGLELIEKIPRPSAALVEIVAASAFNEKPQRSGIFPDLDIRPLARVILASQRERASAYGARASEQISIENSLGTSAAQIAVATGQPRALETVSDLMRKALEDIPKDKVIWLGMRNRLYELAYALYFGGAAARPFVAPLQELMRRRVSVPVHWTLGSYTSADPVEMCAVLAAIQGKSRDVLPHLYCHGKATAKK